MVALAKKIKAFTLIESIVSGVIISVVSGLALMIYLNVAASLSNTVEIQTRQIVNQEFDSLRNKTGTFTLVYPYSDYLTIECEKKLYYAAEHTFELRLVLFDSTDQMLAIKKGLVYEPEK